MDWRPYCNRGYTLSTTRERRRPVVLVVDDAPSSLGMLCDTLEEAGYSVLVATDGESALARLALVSPDAILLDAVMPGLSGFDTCRRIKSDPALAHIPIIFMTGLSDTADVLTGFESGGTDYVVKPLRAPEVLARLQTHTRNAKAARLAREALDVADLGVLLVDIRGRIAWSSPRARELLARLAVEPADAAGLPDALQAVWTGEVSETLVVLGKEIQPSHVRVRHMGQIDFGESMLLLEGCGDPEAAVGSRLSQAALTPRETEVLSWVAKGKTNRDVGEILGMSPRTVNKHLEHIFEKLGVETRSAAAALASAHFGPAAG